MRHGNWRTHVLVVLLYGAIAVAFTWPLAARLDSHLTGPIGGDTAVYVWNHWVFHHELLDGRGSPYFTDTLFGSDRANLSLHNYTTFQNLIAVPLIGLFGVLATFNVVYLLMTVLTAWATFLLARQVTGRVAESWLAGVLFAWSPLMATRGMGHFSLVAAAPLAVFLLLLMRERARHTFAGAALLGLTIAWATSSDVYYGVYCLLIGGLFALSTVCDLTLHRRSAHETAARILHVMIVGVGLVAATIALTGGWEIRLLDRPVQMRTLWSPMLILTILVLARAALHLRVAVAAIGRPDLLRFAGLVATAGVVCAAVLSPMLYAAALRLAEGEFAMPGVLWRSSPRGVDLLALVLPNPNNPLTPDGVERWLTARPNGYFENVVSVPFVAFAILLVAWRGGWRPPRWWALLSGLSALLALGPFLYVAGVNTYVPGPWAFLRYVPLVRLTHTPARYSIVMMLAVAVLCASALAFLGNRYPARRRAMLGLTAIVLLFELVPVPRSLHRAEPPAFYQIVARAPADVKVLELPFGIRDGTSSIGNFTARTQLYQTWHGRTIMGGYLSRLSPRRERELRADPVLDALATLSEHVPLSAEQRASFAAQASGFPHEWNIGFVVIDHDASSDELTRTAIDAFGLRLVEQDGLLALYVPDAGDEARAEQRQRGQYRAPSSAFERAARRPEPIVTSSRRTAVLE